MANGFNYKRHSLLFSVSEFAKKSELSIDEVVNYIYMGKLFPLAPTRQNVLVRRIPSLLTEHLSKNVSDEESYTKILNKPRLYKGYDQHISNWDGFIRNYSDDALKDNIDLSENCLPRHSDIRFTSGYYVYIEPDVVKEAINFGAANIKRFVFPDMMRGFYSSGCPKDIIDLYDKYRLYDNSEDEDLISIISRFSNDYHLKYGRNPSLCYPDQVSSFDYFGIVDRPLPVALSAIAEYLNLDYKDSEYANVHFNSKWFPILEKADEKLQLNISAMRESYKQFIFHDLYVLSGYLDQWVPFYPERNELICSFESLRLYSNQVQTARSIKCNEVDITTFTDNSRRDFINYHFCLQSAFIYQLMKLVKSKESKSDKNNRLAYYVDQAIELAQGQLEQDELFKIVLQSCSGVSSSENFYQKIRETTAKPCSKVFVEYSKKRIHKNPKDKKRPAADNTPPEVSVKADKNKL